MSATNIERLVAVLAGAEVDFVVIGGVAATIHGSAYVTYDVDVCNQRSGENVERLCRALAAVHPTLRGAPKDLPFRLDPAPVLAGLNFTLDTDLGALDLLGEVSPSAIFRTLPSTPRRSIFSASGFGCFRWRLSSARRGPPGAPRIGW